MLDRIWKKWLRRIPYQNTKGAKRQREKLEKLYPGHDLDLLQERELFNKLKLIFMGLAILLLFFLLLRFVPQEEAAFFEGTKVQRPGYGQAVETKEIVINSDSLKEVPVSLQVEPRAYDEESFEKLADWGYEVLLNELPGENLNLEQVRKPLKLLKQIPGSVLTVRWNLDTDGIVKEDGSLDFEKICEIEKKVIQLEAELCYEEFHKSYVVEVQVIGGFESEEEKLLYHWQKAREKLSKESESDVYQILPEEVDGEKIRYQLQKEDKKPVLLVIGVFIIVLLWFVPEQRMDEQLKKREKQIVLDYPEFINKFTLLLGAGLTIANAFERICREYEKKREQGEELHYVYEEMLITRRDMENGISPYQAYENFGHRMKRMEYIKFSTLITQNLKKGNDTLLSLLSIEAVDAFEKRKEYAKKLGEEAGTKLLFPMILMLGLVMGIIMIPAVMMF